MPDDSASDGCDQAPHDTRNRDSAQDYDVPVRAVALGPDGRPCLADIAEPPPPGDLVSVLACGLCGSDVEKIGVWPEGSVLGHEVVALTDDDRRVALIHHAGCGECKRCLAGHESTCVQFPAPTIVPGGFAERVRASGWVELPAGVEPDGPVDAVVLCAPGGADVALAAVEPGGTVLLFADAGTLPADAVYRRELTVVGSRSGTPAHMAAAVALLPTLEVPEPTVLPFARFAEGFALQREGAVLKVVLVP